MSHVNESCHTWMSHVTREWVMPHVNESSHTWMSHATREWVMSHVNESCHTWMSHVTHRRTRSWSTRSLTTAVCCSVLQCVAVCCSVSQCVAVCALAHGWQGLWPLHSVAVCCSVPQCVAVCRSVLQCVHSLTADKLFDSCHPNMKNRWVTSRQVCMLKLCC